jgi:hypothetical protein
VGQSRRTQVNHHIGGSKGIRTPDPLHAMQVRYQAAPWTRAPGKPGQPVKSTTGYAAGNSIGIAGQSFQRRSSE